MQFIKLKTLSKLAKYIFKKPKNFSNLSKETIGRFYSFLKKERLYWREELNSSDSISIKAYSYVEPILTEEIKNKMNAFEKKPKISILLPVFNIETKWLDKAIASVLNQWYPNWELCIVDDFSSNKDIHTYLNKLIQQNQQKVKVKFLSQRSGISKATNEAFGMSDGEYIGFLDHDDELTVDALFYVVWVINKYDSEFIYSDEDYINENGIKSNPHFKPDFSKETLNSYNYIGHFVVVKRELFEKVKGLNSNYDGAQDYDFVLKCTSTTNKIYHIPRVLYHWRLLQRSVSLNPFSKINAIIAGKKALEDNLKHSQHDISVSCTTVPFVYKVNYKIKGAPLISIIVPFKDKYQLLYECLTSILSKTTYENFEIICVNNKSQLKETFQLMEIFSSLDKRIKFIDYNDDFNYSAINNYAVFEYTQGQQILLLNNDIQVISPNWLNEMLMYSQLDEVGCVGAKLYYPDNTIQHAGVVVGINKYAGHSHRHYDGKSSGYFNRLITVNNVSAVTGACMMVKKEIYVKLGGLDEELRVNFNDIDFCLRVLKAGYRNVFTAYAELYHKESATRGYGDIELFLKEGEYFFSKHQDFITRGDVHYNPNLTLDKEDLSLRKSLYEIEI